MVWRCPLSRCKWRAEKISAKPREMWVGPCWYLLSVNPRGAMQGRDAPCFKSFDDAQSRIEIERNPNRRNPHALSSTLGTSLCSHS